MVLNNYHTAPSPLYILGIESSCDETSAAVLCDHLELSNIIASQELIHRYFGGVVPELASRAHQQKIVPVVEEALRVANITKNELHAVAVTSGPGLSGALHVGISFAKSLAFGLGIPLIGVNHMQGHALCHFIESKDHDEAKPDFPYLCLTVSGGHTQIVLVNEPTSMKILGETMDDAAGEAFDKAARLLGLPYPGGPLIDRYGAGGNPLRFKFPKPHMPGLNYSFSGLKTAFLYFIREGVSGDEGFIRNNLSDICASIQHSIVETLMHKLVEACGQTGIKNVCVAGGVSANSALRASLKDTAMAQNWKLHIPPFAYCTDNAAMIAMAGFFQYKEGQFSGMDLSPQVRMTI